MTCGGVNGGHTSGRRGKLQLRRKVKFAPECLPIPAGPPPAGNERPRDLLNSGGDSYRVLYDYHPHALLIVDDLPMTGGIQVPFLNIGYKLPGC